MKWEMEVYEPPAAASYISATNWLIEESKNTKWTAEENKMFENALAVYDKDTADRWHKVAAMIPGKTVGDVIKQYRELEVDIGNIEAGLIPVPGYNNNTTSCSSGFTLDWVGNSNSNGYDGFKQPYGLVVGKRSSSGRLVEQERKKGVPWTEEEHKLFLLGLKKYGKGDWRNISRNFVITRTPTQVASHAQKYFIRQLSGGKDKRRASIHDITTVNLNDTRTPSPDDKRSSSLSPDQSSVLCQQQQSSGTIATTHFQWNQANSGTTLTFNSPHSSMYMPSPYGIDEYGVKMHSQSIQRGSAVHDHYIGPQNMAFEMQSAQQYSQG